MTSLGRASAIIGAGTLVSRVTGLLRSIVLVAVIGSFKSGPADAFAAANTLPNSVFSLISVGILTAVIVPQIVKATADADGGNAFISKLFTLGTVVLVAVTALATIAAPWLVQIVAGGLSSTTQALATALAYWCLPQILFYGLYALLGEALNARRIFGPFTWAPVVNNIVSIIGFLILGWAFSPVSRDSADWTPEMIALLGGTATLGIAVQALVLLLFWRRTGLSLRPDFQWRGVGLGNVGKLAGWTFLMAFASLSAGVLQGNIVSNASESGASLAVTTNAWLIFMLPYSVIVLSIGTPYFTQISEHAAAGRHDEVRGDISRSIRTLLFFIVAAVAAVAAAAIPASRVFTESPSDAEGAAVVLLCYLVSLIPLTILFIVQRTFYAYDDTRTPFWFTIFQCALIVVTALGAVALLSAEVIDLTHLAAAVALGQSIASTLQTIVATWLLHRKIGGIGILSWLRALALFAVAAIPAGLAGWGTFLLIGGTTGWATSGVIPGALATAVVGLVVVIVYVAILAVFRAPELKAAGGLVRRFLPGR
ncbi:MULTISPECIES: murein biosynthesis integral membrane protein MurJ [unclassified Microbacterium]|uniref:murein biosynthesis integral membrane protein MurJ n=1 Tax=unclassified Microbacterium TaxID=2609290 RepID=UPI0024696BE1|nr:MULTISPECIES: murein biosynthesis integral membrane protein MurJ [unclassified Microbacterium]MDH5132953.1 murein biosynthesis integral membrane protein MurJ [Microbacterium sp. RD10]MDH5136075.1 murein biosynthesis integral membrane protein MurJ [Microbacterium sp. RD11]MDH5145800.1 murein biosynthesis integral membrane protein MurJ [Microbacterium sp. RD12]MDH5154479.1 murein biosynthesis integral membrane protein MurJ [Microbacterium sp. RD06]MDH5167580.1 murein biosynthesis integral mem